MIDLTNKIALVSGASRGIGRATALQLARAGADVVINYVQSRDSADRVAEEIAAMGRRVAIVRADVSEQSDVQSMMEFVGNEFGRLDILVSNAASGGFRPLLAATPKNFEAAMNTNVRALLFLVQAAHPLLGQSVDRAKIVAISSHGSHMALPWYGLIGTSKAALESLIRHMALEFGDQGMNFNVVQAGLVPTDSTKMIPGSEVMFNARSSKTMMGDRQLEPEDVANAVLYLCSPLSDLVQGQVLIIDGGAAIHV
ncbi:short-chain dehydrogenase/reductase SDR [Planctopirus limnophila DSM 3776]|jgi:enoyl-[acyl-carrier protein] reductase III|uniref:Short-chain dehydrogenase/reductase SDR n=2 Tax=Planctopirus TaxID=1649480 RepID=D5SX05_PLAL2|nr:MULTISPECIES: SDR family oxidoreductase [Planctopirus]ADG67505.1 short-chain dehydrogenase/reductase SDR [Planctopirus limnophila DSM 3776]QDV30591.1 Enoyl-[acyl-carrier-protein] reductase [NADPH] FabL [Planctopirus ephydatiae]